MKESFVLYTAYAEQLKLLSMEQRGVLFTAILAYEQEAELPEMDAVVAMAFAFIKSRLDADNARWQETVESRRKAGLASAEARKQKRANGNTDEQKATNSTHVECVEQKATNPTVYEYVNEYEYVNDNKKKGRFKPPTVDEVRAYCFEKGYKFDPEAFVSFYQSKGWKVGNASMKDWKAACVTWNKRKTQERPKHNNIEQHDYDFDAIERHLIMEGMN